MLVLSYQIDEAVSFQPRVAIDGLGKRSWTLIQPDIGRSKQQTKGSVFVEIRLLETYPVTIATRSKSGYRASSLKPSSPRTIVSIKVCSPACSPRLDP
jgi:hypothetical protein